VVLRAKHQAAIYKKLVPVLGEEETEALLSQFPLREAHKPVPVGYLHDKLNDLAAELRKEMSDLRRELEASLAGLRAEGHGTTSR
jgi:hypothetical protein